MNWYNLYEQILLGSIHTMNPYNLYQQNLLGFTNIMNLYNLYRKILLAFIHTINEHNLHHEILLGSIISMNQYNLYQEILLGFISTMSQYNMSWEIKVAIAICSRVLFWGQIKKTSNISKQFFLIGIHFMQGWTAIARHGVTRKRSTKRLKHRGNLFRKNLQLIGVC